MPAYAHLASNTIDFSAAASKLRAMKSVGVPYKPEEIAGAGAAAKAQAETITTDLAASGITLGADTELVALIAYMQRLGVAPAASAPAVPSVASNR